MQLQLGRVSEDTGRRNKGLNVRVMPRKENFNPLLNKRKLSDALNPTWCEQTEQKQKRGNKTLRSFLDLNLPVEDEEQDYENNSISDMSEAWLEDFHNHVDERVVFKPFDFDSLADDLVRRINIRFQRIFGSEALLDIDYDVILQILAASWLSDREKVEEWVDDVLTRMLRDAQQKYDLNAHSVVKLQVCNSTFVEDEAANVRLPAKINLN
jgi:hypothetical protein